MAAPATCPTVEPTATPAAVVAICAIKPGPCDGAAGAATAAVGCAAGRDCCGGGCGAAAGCAGGGDGREGAGEDRVDMLLLPPDDLDPRGMVAVEVVSNECSSFR